MDGRERRRPCLFFLRIRYDNGIQVVWGSFGNITVGTFITFPMPFSMMGYGIVCDKCIAEDWQLNGFTASAVESVYVSYNCVGYWK